MRLDDPGHQFGLQPRHADADLEQEAVRLYVMSCNAGSRRMDRGLRLLELRKYLLKSYLDGSALRRDVSEFE